MRYSPQCKEAVLAKMRPPQNRSVPELAEEEGISTATRYKWRREAQEQGQLLPRRAAEPEGWRSSDKFHAVLETAALSETEVAEYCRQRGLYPEHLQRWRAACEQANDRAQEAEQRHSAALKGEKARGKRLERELQRKEAALADTAALLSLRKKVQAIWGESEDA
jgi:transposase-like protein